MNAPTVNIVCNTSVHFKSHVERSIFGARACLTTCNENLLLTMAKMLRYTTRLHVKSWYEMLKWNVVLELVVLQLPSPHCRWLGGFVLSVGSRRSRQTTGTHASFNSLNPTRGICVLGVFQSR